MGIPEETIAFFSRLDELNRTTVKSVVGLSGDTWYEEGVGQEESGGWFTAETGWCQGAEEAPLGWTLFYDILLSFLEVSNPQTRGIQIRGPGEVTETLDTEAYTDDTISYAGSHAAMQKTVDCITLFLTFMGLEVAAAKCKYTCTPPPGGALPPPLALKSLLNVLEPPQLIPCLPPETAFRYLGVWVSLDGKWSTQKGKLVSQSTAVLQAMKCRALEAGGAEVLLSTVLRARILYPAKFTTLTEEEMKALEWPARREWLHRHTLASSTSKRRAGMHKADGGLGWQSWFQAMMVEKTLTLLVSINGHDKLAFLLQGQMQRWGEHGVEREVSDRWTVTPPVTGHRTRWKQAWLGSILHWLDQQGASLRRRDLVYEVEDLQPPAYGAPAQATDVDRETAMTFSDGTGSYQKGVFRTAYACVDIDDEEGGRYTWPAWGNPVGGDSGDQTVARSEALGLLEGLRAGPSSKTGISQTHHLDRQGSVTTFGRLGQLSPREWLNLRNRDVWLSAALWSQRLPCVKVLWQRGHPERIPRLEWAAWSVEQVGIHRADSEADKVMETWRDEGFPDKPRPQPERGSVMRWEIWEGEAEVVTSMRETLWKLARCAQTREVHTGVSRKSTYSTVPTLVEGGADKALLNRAFRSATRNESQLQESEWNGDFSTEDLDEDWGAVGWESTYVNSKRFKFLWGLLPDQTIRGNRHAWRNENLGKGAACLVCGEPLLHDSNEHALLLCKGPRIVVARYMWLRRIHTSIVSAEFPPAMAEDLLATWALSQNGSVDLTAQVAVVSRPDDPPPPPPSSWRQVLRHTERSCVWRGLLPTRWTDFWWEGRQGPPGGLHPGEIRDKLARVVRGVWRGWNAVWKEYCTEFHEALVRERPSLLSPRVAKGLHSQDRWALELLQQRMEWLLAQGLQEFVEVGAVSIKVQSSTAQIRWAVADQVRVIPHTGPFGAVQGPGRAESEVRQWEDVRLKAIQILARRSRLDARDLNRHKGGTGGLLQSFRRIPVGLSPHDRHKLASKQVHWRRFRVAEQPGQRTDVPGGSVDAVALDTG